MSNNYFRFKQFNIQQEHCAMKVTTDGCLFGAWIAGIRKNERRKINVLDIGTGTGLLALMLAQKNENALIDAVEIDAAAATQAAENVLHSPWKDRIRIHHADVQHFKNEKQYDLIISNPPFYENEWSSPDEKRKIAHHNEGLLLKDLFSILQQRLSAGGSFALLLPYKRKDEIENSLAGAGLVITKLVQVKQTVKHDFFRLLIMGRLATTTTQAYPVEELSIKDEHNAYTKAFTELLKDYYLYLS